jgi:peptidoglycan/xylan/chitin deacetylase (PgdA/CDA1 family)
MAVTRGTVVQGRPAGPAVGTPRVVLSPRSAAGAWWQAAGVTPWAAYGPRGAASFAASLVDLTGQGHNATDPGGAATPAWDAVNGWTFDGVGTYLQTTFVPAQTQAQTLIVQYTRAALGESQCITASFGGSGNTRFGLYASQSAGTAAIYQNGGAQQVGPAMGGGNLAVAGNQGYRNGIADGDPVAAYDNAPDDALYIGARNNDGTPDYFLGGRIQSLALFDSVLTAPQVKALATAMAAAGVTVPGPVVCFHFDDGLEPVYTLAYPALAAAGIPATVYIPSDYIGDTDRMTAAQLLALDAAGWSIGNHGQTHDNFTTLTQAQIETELSTAQAALDALGLTGASRHVAYPNGQYNADSDAAMTATGMLTGRAGEIVADQFLPWSNPYRVIPRVIMNTDTLATVESWLDAAIGRPYLYLCLLFHNIVESEPTSYQWLASDFQALVTYAAGLDLSYLNAADLYTLQAGL